MKNIELKRDGDKLIIEVDLSKNYGPSKSGKSIIVASSEGNTRVPDIIAEDADTFIGLNVYRKR